jgi:hypothetical protein
MDGVMRKDSDLHRRRRGRNIGLLLVLLAVVGLLFWVTLVKLGENAANPWG